MGSISPDTDLVLERMRSEPASDSIYDGADPPPPVPEYLSEHYWWSYVHPRAVRVFERPWLVNLILWGKYVTMRDAAVAELGETLPGRTLQVACVYGDLTPRLAARTRRR